MSLRGRIAGRLLLWITCPAETPMFWPDEYRWISGKCELPRFHKGSHKCGRDWWEA